MKKPHIAIIGASFAGLSTYLVLKKRCGDTINITLLDQRDQFTYIPALHETLYESAALKKIQFDLPTYYPEFQQATITSLSKERVITTDTGKHISCDYAVIATGSRTNYFGKEDFEKNTYALRHAEDVGVLNSALQKAKHICVIGGGYTGIEIASTIATRKSADQTISLVHSRDRLGHTYDNSTSKKIHARMQHNNVNLILGERATSISEHTITLASGKIIPSECSILSSGIKINDEIHTGELNFEIDSPVYCSRESENIYCAGDVALCGLHTTAHNAMIEGRRVGHLIADKIERKEKSYTPLQDRTTLGMALGTRDGLIVNEKGSLYVPQLLGFFKKIVEWRVLFEFKKKIMLWV